MPFGDGAFTYELVDDWARLPGDESFVDVCKVCIDERDHVWVLNRGDHPVMEFDPTGKRLAAWGSEHFSDRPHGMSLGQDGDIYCTDDKEHVVLHFDRDGTLLETIGEPGTSTDTGFHSAPTYWEQVATISQSAGPFNRPTGVTVANDGTIYVADGYGNARIHEFDADGSYRGGWGDPGAAPGQFRVPHSIELHDDRLWVADRENSRIQVFDRTGEVDDVWIDLIRPTDVCFHDDAVFVSEFACRVSIFDTSGELRTKWGNEAAREERMFVAPHTIATDSNGDLYVGEVAVTYGQIDRGARAIRKFERVEST